MLHKQVNLLQNPCHKFTATTRIPCHTKRNPKNINPSPSLKHKDPKKKNK